MCLGPSAKSKMRSLILIVNQGSKFNAIFKIMVDDLQLEPLISQPLQAKLVRQGQASKGLTTMPCKFLH